MFQAGTIMTSHIPVESSRNSNAMSDPLGSSDGSQSISGISFAVVAAIQEAEDEKLTGELNEVDSLLFYFVVVAKAHFSPGFCAGHKSKVGTALRTSGRGSLVVSQTNH